MTHWLLIKIKHDLIKLLKYDIYCLFLCRMEFSAPQIFPLFQLPPLPPKAKALGSLYADGRGHITHPEPVSPPPTLRHAIRLCRQTGIVSWIFPGIIYLEGGGDTGPFSSAAGVTLRAPQESARWKWRHVLFEMPTNLQSDQLVLSRQNTVIT